MKRVKKKAPLLKRRVQDVVRRYWNGNVKTAAKEIGIPQNTLYRIVSGETPNPRVQVLTQIAQYCGTSVEWLISGSGDPPAETTGSGLPISHNILRWQRLLGSLKLREPVHSLCDRLPWGPLCLASMMWDHEGKEFSGGPPVSARVASNLCAGAWADILEALIRRYGAKAVGHALESSPTAIACGLSWFGSELQGSRIGNRALSTRVYVAAAKLANDEIAESARLKAIQKAITKADPQHRRTKI